MTNYEAISAMLYPYEVDRLLIEKECIDNNTSSEGAYSVAHKADIARITISILRNLLVLNSESDSGYALSYSVEGLRKRIADIAKDNELTDIAEEFNDRPSVEFMDFEQW